MANEKEYMDTPAPERYLEHLRKIELPVEENILRLFGGDQNPEFYLGMIAGVKAYMNILLSMPFSQEAEDGFLHISIDLQKVIVQHI